MILQATRRREKDGCERSRNKLRLLLATGIVAVLVARCKLREQVQRYKHILLGAQRSAILGIQK